MRPLKKINIIIIIIRKSYNPIRIGKIRRRESRIKERKGSCPHIRKKSKRIFKKWNNHKVELN